MIVSLPAKEKTILSYHSASVKAELTKSQLDELENLHDETVFLRFLPSLTLYYQNYSGRSSQISILADLYLDDTNSSRNAKIETSCDTCCTSFNFYTYGRSKKKTLFLQRCKNILIGQVL